MTWVNSFDRMFAYTVVDAQAGLSQITIPTTRGSSTPLQDMATSIETLQVDSPLVMRRRFTIADFKDKTPVVASLNCAVQNKWRVTALNQRSGLREVILIPCADLSLLSPGTDLAPLGSPPFAAFVAELESNWRYDVSEAITNPMVVESILYIGG